MIIPLVGLNSAYALLGAGVFSVLYAVCAAAKCAIYRKNGRHGRKEPPEDTALRLENAATAFILGAVLLLFGFSVIKGQKNIAEHAPSAWYEFRTERAEHSEQR